MADFGNFVGGEIKKSLNRKIDYQREKFLKGVSTSKHGKKEDPTYLHFRFIFDTGKTKPIDPETFLAISPLFSPYNDPAQNTGFEAASGASEIGLPDYFTTNLDFFYGSKFAIPEMVNLGAFPSQGDFAYMSAQEFLYQRSKTRRDMLNAFTNGFLYIN